jgi:hypothetical protein
MLEHELFETAVHLNAGGRICNFDNKQFTGN